MSSKIKSSRDIIIRAEALADAVKFYKEVVGLRVASRGEKIVGFETGSFKLYVGKGRGHGPVFEFLVPDVHAAKARLLEAGCILVEEDPELPRCYVRDPYGMTFNIGQSAAARDARD
jgi:catechol 2,3-dioxygenase-like lactoylglutathione lyase family enzyme